MKQFFILLTAFTIFGISLNAQQTVEDSVKAAVNKLFEGMKKADPVLLKEAFTDSAILQTFARNNTGQIIIRDEKVDEFADAISKLKPGAADERIVFETVKIDGPLASVWTPYNFYLDNKFSHCGVNSFQLVRLNGIWKIQYLIDTRRKQGCKP
jgi:Putative lumazine-binding